MRSAALNDPLRVPAEAWHRRLAHTEATLRAEAASAAPDLARVLDARRQRVWTLWMLGRLGQCFAEYRALTELEQATGGAADLPRAAPGGPPLPAWDGAPLGGRCLCVQAREGGFGDLLQWARFLALLRGRDGHAGVETRPELLRLFAHSFDAGFTWTARGDEPPAETGTSLMRLPFLFGLRPADVAASVPYLRPPERDAARWRAWLAGRPRPWIGVCWTGARPGEAHDPRAVPLAQLAAPLRARPGTLVSLQHGRRGEEIAACRLAGVLLEPGDAFADFADSAGLVSQLDLVATCDTAIAHLAGGLGTQARLLLHADAFEGWRLGAPPHGTTLWYPTLRLAQQTRPGDWTAPLEALAADFRDA